MTALLKLRTLPCLAALACLGAAGAASGQPLDLRASAENGSADLKVSVENTDLPKDAVVTIKVTREFIHTKRPPITLMEKLLPFTEPGHAEALYPMGEALAVPGRYRVRASFEKVGQYPKVLEAMGNQIPDPKEVLLDDAAVSKAYLQAVLNEQKFLADSIMQVGGFLDRMNEVAALTDQDRQAARDAKRPNKGIQAWAAWRIKAVPEVLEKVITHGREVRDKFYPITHEQFSERYIFAGLFQMESRKFGAAEAGGAYHGTGTLARQHTSLRPELDPYVNLFRQESLWYRLMMINSLFPTVDTELKAIDKAASKGRQPDRGAWDRKRRDWNEFLALWQADLAPVEPPRPAPYVMLHREALLALGAALTAWMDAEEGHRFVTPRPPEAAEREARRQAVKDRFNDVVQLLKTVR